MKAFLSRNLAMIGIIGAGLLAASAGAFAAVALSSSSQQAPTQTTTITLTDGATGATGPAGPAGPPGKDGTGGAETCPSGSSFQSVVINSPGGHVELWTCVAGA